MKVLVLGSNGFIGREVVKVLRGRHDVYGATREEPQGDHLLNIDLRHKDSIRRGLDTVRPAAIIHCAGIVGGPESNLNVVFTTNLLETIAELELPVQRVIVTGSAAEYGRVLPQQIPVAEDVPLRAESGYGLSKVREISAALTLAKRHNIPVVVARLFNPVGPRMGSKFLISSLLRQIDAIEAGESTSLEISRLDSLRDYVDVRDIACAYVALLEGTPQHDVYNIGSGESTSNGQIIKYLQDASSLVAGLEVRETQMEKEPLVACRADTTRLRTEFGWEPQISIKDSIGSIIHDRKQAR